MKYSSLLALALTFCATSVNASLRSVLTLAKWRAMDACVTPSSETLLSRVGNIIENAKEVYAHLSSQFLKKNNTVKEIADLIAPYSAARYPYMLCVDYMYRAQKDCDAQMQLINYADTCYKQLKSYDQYLLTEIRTLTTQFEALQNTLRQESIRIGETDGYKKDLAQKATDEKNGW